MHEKSEGNKNLDDSIPIQNRQPQGSVVFYVPIGMPKMAIDSAFHNWKPFAPSSSVSKESQKNHFDKKFSISHTKSTSLHRKTTKDNMKNISTRISVEMEDLFLSIKPHEEDLEIRLQVLNRISRVIKSVYKGSKNYLLKDCSVRQFGSTANGFSLKKADIDISVFHDDFDGISGKIIEELGRALSLNGFCILRMLPWARIPIVKVKDDLSDISCDVVVNTKLALFNTDLLRTYASIDDRLAKLGLIIKYFSKKRKINDPFYGTLSSYCYILMLIHFFQNRPNPILPSLQKLPGCVQTIIDGHNVGFVSDSNCIKKHFKGVNNECLGELLISFSNITLMNSIIETALSVFEKVWK